MTTITHVVVPGTFDPITLGHIDVIRRARRLFSEVTVAVAESQNKHGSGTTFTLDKRIAMVRDALSLEGLPDDISVVAFSGLLVDLCRSIGAGGVVKGLRAMTDFEYELQQAGLNSHMAPELESVFVMSSTSYGYVSSSVVREIAAMGADVSTLVPANVDVCLRHRFGAGESS